MFGFGKKKRSGSQIIANNIGKFQGIIKELEEGIKLSQEETSTNTTKIIDAENAFNSFKMKKQAENANLEKDIALANTFKNNLGNLLGNN
jgi:regulatory protein YycI of two-component signal transduction system YycFG